MIVRLRPLRVEDAFTSIRWRSDPEVWKYTRAAGRQPPRLEDEINWIKSVVDEPNGRRFAIEVDGAYVGNVYFTGITDREAEFHIVIGDRNLWGKGIAKLATVEALALAWKELDLNSVRLIVHKDNAAAIRIYDGLNFRRIGQQNDFVEMAIDGPAAGTGGR